MPSVGVVMLTINQEDHRVVEAIRPGAAGYLVKDADLDDIVAGIRTAANPSWAPAATRSVMAELRGMPPAPKPSPTPRLTGRERDVLSLLGRGCGNAEIGRRLYLDESRVSLAAGGASAQAEIRSPTQCGTVRHHRMARGVHNRPHGAPTGQSDDRGETDHSGSAWREGATVFGRSARGIRSAVGGAHKEVGR